MKLTWSDLETAKSKGFPLNLATPQDFRKIRLAMLEDLRKSELLARYVHDLTLHEKATGYHNTEPWQAMGEQELAVLYVLYQGNNAWHSWQVDPYDLSGNDEAAVIAALLAGRATPCLWATEIERIAVATEMPGFELTKDTCPYPEGLFVSRETCLHLWDEKYPAKQLVTNWLLVVPLAEFLLTMFDLGDPETEQTMIVRKIDNYGSLIEHDDLHIFRMLAFMQSPYVGTERHYLPRHLRRHTKTPSSGQPRSAIRVELLRRSASGMSSHSADSRHIDWQHQWWVRGHYRLYKRTKKVAYVRPHLKGPDDKPILKHVYKVGR